MDWIFSNHSVDSRPIRNPTHSIEIKFGIELIQLTALNERNQYMTTKLWVRQFWTSELMTWRPEEWGGVDELSVDPRQVWTPDTLLYNNADGSSSGGPETYPNRVTIYPNGLNTWLSPAKFSSMCKINVKYFPFDTQTCKMKFGSWAFDTSKVNLTQHSAPMVTTQYLNSSTWDVSSITAELNTVTYSCCVVGYQDITFSIVLTRRPLYYVFNILAPCIVLISMVLFSFYLPPESGERLGLNITVLLALALFLEFLGASLPKNSDSTPIVSVLFITLMTECGIALSATILVLSVYHKGDEYGVKPPPRWTKLISNPNEIKGILHKLYCDIRFTNAPISRDNIQHYEVDIEDNFVHTSVAMLKRMGKKLKKVMSGQEEIILLSLQDILHEIDKINTNRVEHEIQEDNQSEWKALAKALDRLFFFVFLIVFTLSIIGVMIGIAGHSR